LETAGTEQTVKKRAARNWHDGRWNGSIEIIQNLSCLSIL